jgi:hypothetical protein
MNIVPRVIYLTAPQKCNRVMVELTRLGGDVFRQRLRHAMPDLDDETIEPEVGGRYMTPHGLIRKACWASPRRARALRPKSPR